MRQSAQAKFKQVAIANEHVFQQFLKFRKVMLWDRLPEVSRLGKTANPQTSEGITFERRRTILLRISKSSAEGQPSEKADASGARGACCLSGGWSLPRRKPCQLPYKGVRQRPRTLVRIACKLAVLLANPFRGVPLPPRSRMKEKNIEYSFSGLQNVRGAVRN